MKKLYCWICCVIAVLLALLAAPTLSAQCPRHLSEVFELERLYDQGRFEEILYDQSRIEEMRSRGHCVDSLFLATHPRNHPSLDQLTTAERFIHLYILTAYAVDRLDLVEGTLPLFVQRFPQFTPNLERDPPAMYLAMDSLVPYAAQALGVYGGPMLCLIQVEDPQALHHDLAGDTNITARLPVYRNRLGYNFGFEFKEQFGYRHGLLVGLTFKHQSWSSTYRSYDTEEGEIGDWRIEQFDHYNSIHIPVLYQYRIPLQKKRKLHASWLQFQGGGYGSYMIHGETDLKTYVWKFEDNDTIENPLPPITIGSPISRRVKYAWGLQGGIGYQMDMRDFSWYVRVFGQFGLTQLRVRHSEYDPDFTSHIWNYHLVENNFRLSSVGVHVGISLPKGSKVKNLHKK